MKTVLEIQRELLDLGYDIGPDGADGEWGDNSRKALAQFQMNNRLPVDGNRADPETLKLLFPDDYKARTTPMNNILGGMFAGLLGNLFRSQALMGYLRNLLLALGTTIGATGFVGDNGWAIIVGSIMAIIGVVADAISNATKQKAIDVVKAVDAAPNVTVIPATETPDKRPDVVVTK
jgi:peptidoglycan hydrolase-like protein with peptidoglycan-binding domain